MKTDKLDDFDVDLETGNGADQGQHQDGADLEVDGADLPSDRAEGKTRERPSRGERRYNIMTARLRQLERHNAELAGELQAQRQRSQTGEVDRNLEEAEATVSQRWNDAKARYRQALIKQGKAAANGEDDAAEAAATEAAEAQAEMTEQAAKATRLREHRETLRGRQAEGGNRDQRGREPPQGQQQRVPLQDWVEENGDWFVPPSVQGRTEDQIEMTDRALKIEDALVKRGMERGSRRILTAIDQQMRRAFPDYFGATGGAPSPSGRSDGIEIDLRPPAQNGHARQQQARQNGSGPPLVGSTPGGTGVSAGRVGRVRLTPEEVAYARDTLHMTPEMYARGKALEAEQNA